LSEYVSQHIFLIIMSKSFFHHGSTENKSEFIVKISLIFSQ